MAVLGHDSAQRRHRGRLRDPDLGNRLDGVGAGPRVLEIGHQMSEGRRRGGAEVAQHPGRLPRAAARGQRLDQRRHGGLGRTQAPQLGHRQAGDEVVVAAGLGDHLVQEIGGAGGRRVVGRRGGHVGDRHGGQGGGDPGAQAPAQAGVVVGAQQGRHCRPGARAGRLQVHQRRFDRRLARRRPPQFLANQEGALSGRPVGLEVGRPCPRRDGRWLGRGSGRRGADMYQRALGLEFDPIVPFLRVVQDLGENRHRRLRRRRHVAQHLDERERLIVSSAS